MLGLTLAAIMLLGTARPVSASEPPADAAVRAIADRIWQRQLTRDPDARIDAGLPVIEFPDPDEASFRDDMQFAEQVLADLRRTPAEGLSWEWTTTRDLLIEQYATRVAGAPFYWLDFAIVPYKANFSFNQLHQILRSHRLAADDDLVAYLALVGEYRELIEQHHRKLRGQADRGLRLGRPAAGSVRAMLEGLRQGLEANLLVDPARLAALPAARREAFRAELRGAIDTGVHPALEALLAYLGPDYLAAAPEAVGIGQYPGGRDYYRVLIRSFTTTTLDPEEIHRIGLRRVEAVRARIAAQAARIGFTGSLPEFFAQLREDRRFRVATPEQLEALYLRHVAAIEPLIDRYFAERPAAPYGVARLAPAAERGLTYGFYSSPSPDRPRGLYFYNGADVADRSQISARALIYHELVPGHHFQFAQQRENEGLHPVRQRYSVSAFGEGWAEYAASLGYEMGLYADPYDDIGRALNELFLACRLVLDTGLADRGWSLEQARAFMRANAFATEAEIQSETLRYATWPGQALAFGIGYEKIWELRRRAEQQLGDRFDLRAFHRTVLSGGALPLTVLERRIDRFIANSRRRPVGTEAARGDSRN